MTIPLDKRVVTRVTAALDVLLAVSDGDTRKTAALVLTPAESALLGQQLIDAAEEAVHESRRRRRAEPVTPGVCTNVGVRGVVGPCVRPYPHPESKHMDPLGRIW